MKIPFSRLDPELPVPARAHHDDAGIDLHARFDANLAPGEWAMIPTGIAVAIPDGHAGLVAPRSGLAARHGISVVNGPGVVDAGYRGEINVILINHGTEPLKLSRGDRIAQLVVVPVVLPELVEVDELPESTRGAGGFGSSGL
ncbi:MAG: dUTP diphosphatase [Actinomycetota bacterium]|nr:dUTP diphosphatase [Actinomycetota bacterium]